MNLKIDVLAASYAAAGLSALLMIALTVLNSLGLYRNAVAQMQEMHLFYTPTVTGTITGLIEAAVISFVIVYIFSIIYNKLIK